MSSAPAVVWACCFFSHFFGRRFLAPLFPGVRLAIGRSETNMTRLILTTSDSGAGALMRAGFADVVIPFGFRFVWGPLPPDAELAMLLAPRSPEQDPAVPYWLDFLDRRRRGAIGRKGLGLIELCEQCERVELWIDPVPNAQLILVQLLDYFHAHAKLAPKLRLVQANVVIGNMLPDALSKWTQSRSRSLRRCVRGRQPGVASLSTADSGELARSAGSGSQRVAAAWAGGARVLGRAAHARQRTWRDHAGADSGRRRAPLRCLSGLREA
jgi:hypothetical protein